MGNFHCIPSSCAKVVYREYLPPVVRWRYEGEDWQEIEADDYSLETASFQCPVPYVFSWRHRPSPNNDWRYFETGNGSIPPYSGFKFIYNDTAGKRVEGFPILSEAPVSSRTRAKWQFSYSGFDEVGNVRFYIFPDSYGDNLFNLVATSEFLGGRRVDNQPDDCGECTFQVFKNGQLVFERITDADIGCPEIEQLDCRLSNISKEIRIDKFPYLERVEIVPYLLTNYREFGVPAPIVQAEPIPDECLNIYLNNVLTLLPYNSEDPESNLYIETEPFNSFIAQICSKNGCPPPEYEVICDCNDSCQSCPDDTCAVNCDGHICCYDTNTGISVKQIAIADYCGGTN